MEESEITRQLNDTLLDIVSNSRGYDAVHCLLIHWAEADDPGIVIEVNAMRSLFQEKFGFSISEYQIPSENAGAMLQLTLARLCVQSSGQKNPLLVVYYAGHGDQNPDERRSIWAAKRLNGSTLNWYNIQPTLYSWNGNVLMILDCCYALQAFRGRSDRTFEILAASGVVELTPPAGDWSFTKRLITVMSSKLRAGGSMTVEEVYASLLQLSGKDKVFTTPNRILLQGSGESIELRPFKSATISPMLDDNKPLALLALTVSISQPFDKYAFERFHKWLRTHIPRDISAIKVDEVFLKTDHIQAWLQSNKKPELRAAIVEDLHARGHKDILTLQPSILDPPVYQSSSKERSEAVEAETTLSQLYAWNDQAYQAIQSNVLLNPSFYSPEAMKELQNDSTAADIGLSESATLRLLNARLGEDFDYSSITQIPHGSVTQIQDPGQYSFGNHSTGIVVIENRTYGDGIEQKESMILKVKRLSRLFREVSNPIFSIAPYVGYIDRPLYRQIGLVFQTRLSKAQTDRPFVTLEEAYRREKSVSLNTRLTIAVRISRALSNLHAVGWLHKSLRSEKIVFLENATGVGFDYYCPYIFGFDLSRPRVDQSDGTKEFRRSKQLYTHPKRWGQPQETFSAIHDIYALGVMLLEIGCWRHAAGFDRTKNGFCEVNNEEQVRDQFVEAADTYLHHMAGDKYTQAVRTCLVDELEVKARDVDEPLILHKAFVARVVEPLEKALGGL